MSRSGRRQPFVATRQKLVFVKEWRPAGDQYLTPRARPIPYTEPEEPVRVWTLYGHDDENAPPPLPFSPVHNKNAFLEDYVHDWNIHGWGDNRFLDYASRVVDRPVWILLEF